MASGEHDMGKGLDGVATSGPFRQPPTSCLFEARWGRHLQAFARALLYQVLPTKLWAYIETELERYLTPGLTVLVNDGLEFNTTSASFAL
jgi:hypothetical protein